MKFDKIYKTQYPNLGYTKIGIGCWMFVEVDPEDGEAFQIGGQYPSRATLEGDIRAFAEERGFVDKPSQIDSISKKELKKRLDELEAAFDDPNNPRSLTKGAATVRQIRDEFCS